VLLLLLPLLVGVCVVNVSFPSAFTFTLSEASEADPASTIVTTRIVARIIFLVNMLVSLLDSYLIKMSFFMFTSYH
jgi:hypothetical protein